MRRAQREALRFSFKSTRDRRVDLKENKDAALATRRPIHQKKRRPDLENPVRRPALSKTSYLGYLGKLDFLPFILKKAGVSMGEVMSKRDSDDAASCLAGCFPLPPGRCPESRSKPVAITII